MIRNLRHVCLVAKDLDESLKFYQDILGLKLFKKLTVEGEYPETAFNLKGAKLTYVKLHSPDQPKDRPPIFELHYWQHPRKLPKAADSHISFTVDDIEYEYNRLRSLGVKFLSAPIITPDHNTKICFGYDPDKNLIEFVEELNRRRLNDA